MHNEELPHSKCQPQYCSKPRGDVSDLCLSPLPPYSIGPVEQPGRLVRPSFSPSATGLPLFTWDDRDHCPSGHIQSFENRGHWACSGHCCPYSPSSSLQICLGDVMKNRVVDEVETAHPAPGFPGTPLSVHSSHRSLQPPGPGLHTCPFPGRRDG